METRITLKARGHVTDRGEFYLGIGESTFSVGVFAPNITKARQKLAGEVLERLEGYEAMTRNSERATIACKDGTVLLVEFRHGAWGYSITGKDRHGQSGVNMGTVDDFASTFRYAMGHASTGFGGVAWVCPARYSERCGKYVDDDTYNLCTREALHDGACRCSAADVDARVAVGA